MGLEKSEGSCFWRQLHKCKGACVGAEPANEYNNRLLGAFERQRVRAWPYKGPVLLQEKTAILQAQAIVVDQWCVLGEIVQEEYCEPVFKPGAKHFDLDTYKILQSFLASKLDRIIIQHMTSEQLAALGV